MSKLGNDWGRLVFHFGRHARKLAAISAIYSACTICSFSAIITILPSMLLFSFHTYILYFLLFCILFYLLLFVSLFDLFLISSDWTQVRSLLLSFISLHISLTLLFLVYVSYTGTAGHWIWGPCSTHRISLPIFFPKL